MAITPAEIRNLKFKKKARGYDPKEVHKWLELIADEFEKLMLQNKEYEEKVKTYEEMEDLLKETILSAKESMEKLKRTAEKQAQEIIDKAKIEADKIIKEAYLKRAEIEKDCEVLKAYRDSFLHKIKAILEALTEVVDKMLRGVEITPEEYEKVGIHQFEKVEKEGSEEKENEQKVE